MILTYKYRIKDKTAKKHLCRHAWSVNQVWNYCNAVQKDVEKRYRAGGVSKKWPSAFDYEKLCKGVGKELGLYQQTVGLVCSRYTSNRDTFGKSLRFRKSFGTNKSLGWIPFTKQNQSLQGNTITYLDRCYHWFGNKRRPLPNDVRGGCFVEDSRGRWYVCFSVNIEPPSCRGADLVGLDLGLDTFVTFSNGSKVKSPKFYQTFEKKLAVQRRARNKKRCAAIHAKIKNQRHDFLHKLSTKLIRSNSIIVTGHVSSASLKINFLQKSIYDAGWYMFKEMLKYKCGHAGALYLQVDEAFTTQTCSVCQARSGPKGIAGLGIREWECSECGTNHDRDVNSARNILALGLSTQPPAEGSSLDRDKCEYGCRPF